MSCKGTGLQGEVHEQKLVKRGITYRYMHGTVECPVCGKYVELRGYHSVPVDFVPDHEPREGGRQCCEICGEGFKPSDERAEMYDAMEHTKSVVCHAQCGLSAGLEIA